MPTNPTEAVKIHYLPQKVDPNRDGHRLIFSRAPSFFFLHHQQEAKSRYNRAAGIRLPGSMGLGATEVPCHCCQMRRNRSTCLEGKLSGLKGVLGLSGGHSVGVSHCLITVGVKA